MPAVRQSLSAGVMNTWWRYQEINMHSTKAHHNLAAGQVARELVKRVYILTRTFPREELFVLTIQVRRAATRSPLTVHR